MAGKPHHTFLCMRAYDVSTIERTTYLHCVLCSVLNL